MDVTSALDRRSLLKVAGGGAVLGGLGLTSGAFSRGATTTLCLRQPGRAVAVSPLSGDRVVGSYYDETGDAPSTGNERPAESTLALYDGPSGRSLVVTHGERDHPNQKQGGVALSFRELPTDAGEWTLRDDPDDWERTTDADAADTLGLPAGRPPTRVQWRWKRGRADGGIFTGDYRRLAPLTVVPHFGWGITDWTFLAGDPEDPRRIPLDPTEPVRIHRLRGRVADVSAAVGERRGRVRARVTPPAPVAPEDLDVESVAVGPDRSSTPGASSAATEPVATTVDDGALVVDAPRGVRTAAQTPASSVVGETVRVVGTDGDGTRIVGEGRVETSRHRRLRLFVQQGRHRRELATHATDRRVARVYDYRDYRPNTALARSRATVIAPVDGPRGTSLLFLHGKAEDGESGAVELSFSGLPAGSSWVLKDDVSDWRREGSAPPRRIGWAWDRFESPLSAGEADAGDQADGAVLRGGLDWPFALRIDPSVDHGVDDLFVPVADGGFARFDPNHPLQIRRWFR